MHKLLAKEVGMCYFKAIDVALYIYVKAGVCTETVESHTSAGSHCDGHITALKRGQSKARRVTGSPGETIY